jgi:hypothetical protein
LAFAQSGRDILTRFALQLLYEFRSNGDANLTDNWIRKDHVAGGGFPPVCAVIGGWDAESRERGQ